MTAGQLYAFVTFLTGLILLMGWLYATTENPRSSGMLLKSILLFVVPGAAIVALPEEADQFPLSMWVLVLVEELLKASAAATERQPMDRFFLVTLFGIWELLLAKPLWGLNHSAALEDWTSLQLAGLTGAGVLVLLMHSVTAQIYAFRFKGRLVLALLASWTLHTAFNELVDVLGVSWRTFLLLFLPLLLLFLALWPKKLPQVRSSSSS